MNLIVSIVLLVLAGFTGLNGLLASSAAESVMHQIYAVLNYLLAAILFVGALIHSHLGQLKNDPKSVDEVPTAMLARLTRLTEDMDELKADVAWFRDLRKREIAIAKANRKPPIPPAKSS